MDNRKIANELVKIAKELTAEDNEFKNDCKSVYKQFIEADKLISDIPEFDEGFLFLCI